MPWRFEPGITVFMCYAVGMNIISTDKRIGHFRQKFIRQLSSVSLIFTVSSTDTDGNKCKYLNLDNIWLYVVEKKAIFLSSETVYLNETLLQWDVSSIITKKQCNYDLGTFESLI